MMTRTCFYLLVIICRICALGTSIIEKRLHPKPYIPKLVRSASDLLCDYKASAIYVYFENETSLGYSQNILRNLNECGTSFIALRKNHKNIPLSIINDDGVGMYLALIIKDANEAIDLSIVQKKSASKHHSFITVIVEDRLQLYEGWLKNAFQQFWDIWILRAIILYWQDDAIQVYRYSPFNKYFIHKIRPRNGHYWHSDLFPNNLPNLNGHPLRICLFEDEVRAIFQPNGEVEGANGFMASFLTNRLNATAVIHGPPEGDEVYGHLANNGVMNGCLGLVANASTDMALNTRFLIREAFEHRVEHSTVFGRDDFCIMVPKAGRASLIWNIFRAFHCKVWVFVVVTFFACYCLVRFLYPEDRSVLLKLYYTMLNGPYIRLPSRSIGRKFIIFWLAYCLVISNSYKSNLTSNLVFRRSLPDINTLAELVKSPFTILSYERHEKYIQRQLKDNFNVLNDMVMKVVSVSEDTFAERIDANDLRFAYLEKAHLLYYRINSKKHYANGRPLFHAMKVCPIPFESVYIVPYGSPYLGFLNKIVRRAQEHGFIVHWANIMDAQAKVSGKSVIRSSPDDDPVVLRLDHLQAAFYLLGFGLSVATVVFTWEVYWFKDGHELVKEETLDFGKDIHLPFLE